MTKISQKQHMCLPVFQLFGALHSSLHSCPPGGSHLRVSHRDSADQRRRSLRSSRLGHRRAGKQASHLVEGGAPSGGEAVLLIGRQLGKIASPLDAATRSPNRGSAIGSSASPGPPRRCSDVCCFCLDVYSATTVHIVPLS